MAQKILLADDSITIQKVVNLTFTDEGIDVVTVGNGELALKKLREDVFDLVLADIFMPGRNGYEVCEYIKGQPQLARVPVILLVGAFEPFDRSEASRVRADGHLTKPFESRILVDTVKRMLAQVQPRTVEEPAPPPTSGWGVPPSGMAPAGAAESAEYDPYASTAKITPYMTGMDSTPEQTQVIGSPFSSPAPEPGSESRFEQPIGDMFQFNVSGLMSVDVPTDDSASSTYVTQPHAPLEETTEYDEEPAESPGTLAFGGEQPETVPSWDEPTVISSPPAQTTDFGVVEPHTYDAGFVEERRDPLLESFDDVAQATAHVDSAADPELVLNAQTEDEGSMKVGPVVGLTSAWDTGTVPAAFRSEAGDRDDSEAEVGSSEFEAAADDVDFSSRTRPYTPGAMRPFDAAEVAADPESSEAQASPPQYDASRTQAYRFDLAPFSAAEQDVESVDAEAAPAEDVAAEPAGVMDALPIEIVDAPEMPETAPPPPKSLPTPDFNFDPTRTQQYEFGLPPFEQDEEEKEESEAVEEPAGGEPESASATVAVAGTGTGDLDFTPPPPPISDEPLEAAFADTAPLRLGTVASAQAEESNEEPSVPASMLEDGASSGPSLDTNPVEPVEAEPVAAAAEAASTNGAGGHAESGADLLAVPSDIIDEIVKRTVERMSDDVIREIAWEVVPDLAARLIKKHLAEGQ
jgi:CheY-like chemotaxis protein